MNVDRPRSSPDAGKEPARPVPRGAPTSRQHLDRLAAELGRRGWTAEPRYGEYPPMLRVYAARVPAIGESVTVDGLWFWSSTGACLARCSDVERAAGEVTALLVPWLSGSRT
ncbi:hypothetical protein [Actinomadura rudentiformis]|uniref:Uncharacterized protein n=1 Tax=Actinomadura rudentiformis TaxID=359158 RepID=A0A6H9Y8Q9_9ACTN|nr:hypothetical protein [Actinomadura rudentiformis]KAB2341326.1 hypothetical protein F8566_42180 [Actinomadura rudentiformis]